MTTRKEYIIRLPKDAGERRMTLAFIGEQMQKTYGSRPPEITTPEKVFIVVHDGSIIGTLGTHYGTRNTSLPFEGLFNLDRAHFPLPYEREKTIYYSRWTSAQPGAGQIVWLVASEHAISLGMTTSIAMIKKFVEEQFMKFGCRWMPIRGAVIKPEKIALTDHAYFFEGSPPYLCMGQIEEQIRELPEIVENIKRKYGISVIVEI